MSVFSLDPVQVPRIDGQFRRIQTLIPEPDAVARYRTLRQMEPLSMQGQPPIFLKSGRGAMLITISGNKYTDLSSGVVNNNCGYGHPRIMAALRGQISTGLTSTYLMPTEARQAFIAELVKLLPSPLDTVFALSTGSEAAEAAIKIALNWALQRGDQERKYIISFGHGFHGRTMGSQLAGGTPAAKDWIPGDHREFFQVEFPDGWRCEDTSFEHTLRQLKQAGIKPEQIAAVMCESFQGVSVQMWSAEYATRMRDWCTANSVLLILDEIQSAFGRTGKMFAWEHLGIVPDLATFGKGISGGTVLSAVVGPKEIMDIFKPGSMTSTHSGNALNCAAALANLQALQEENWPVRAAELGQHLAREVKRMLKASNGHIGKADSIGLAAALQFAEPGTTTPDPIRAFQVVEYCFQRGVMLFAPVGVGGGAVKICPPLVIGKRQLLDALRVVFEAVQVACAP